MRFSIVTISFNQADFLEAAIESVVNQAGVELEYIVVDAGSTDESRSILARHSDQISRLILEPDAGPADGLNKGFRLATGDILGFLNADDLLMPGALKTVEEAFAASPELDIVSGHSQIIDDTGAVLRKSHSDLFDLRAAAFGASVLMQPSTFFRRAAFFEGNGFNIQNRSNWDGELFVDMALENRRFGLIDACLSSYRIHASSITGSKKMHAQLQEYQLRMFKRIMQRDWRPSDILWKAFYRVRKHLRNPKGLIERLKSGPVYGSAASTYSTDVR